MQHGLFNHQDRVIHHHTGQNNKSQHGQHVKRLLNEQIQEGKATNAKEVASDLGVQYVVEGSVRKAGNRVRVTAQLIDGTSGGHLWAERYDRNISGLFQLQDELRTRIFSELAIELGTPDLARPAASVPTEVAAYESMLNGRRHEASFTRDGVAQAIAFYEQALAIDPNYGEAIARLANMYDFTSRLGWSSESADDWSRALTLAEMATNRDPANPFAHWTLARILARREHIVPGSTERALEELKIAIEIAPNYADAYSFISLIYAGTWQLAEARAAIKTAFRLNPDGPSWYYQNRGIVSFMEGDYAQSIGDFEIAVERNSTTYFGRIWLGAALAKAGRLEDAEWEIEEAILLGGPESVEKVLASNSVISSARARSAYAHALQLAGLPD